MRDGINAGDDSDRLLIRWQLDSERAEAAAASRLAEPDVDALRGWGTTPIVSVGGEGEPVVDRGDPPARVLICQLPEDIVALRHSDPALARDWRIALRQVLGGALERGYEIAGAARSGWLTLEKP